MCKNVNQKHLLLSERSTAGKEVVVLLPCSVSQCDRSVSKTWEKGVPIDLSIDDIKQESKAPKKSRKALEASRV